MTDGIDSEKRSNVDDLHKGVVYRDDKDIAGILQALEVDVARNVTLGACWACTDLVSKKVLLGSASDSKILYMDTSCSLINGQSTKRLDVEVRARSCKTSARWEKSGQKMEMGNEPY